MSDQSGAWFHCCHCGALFKAAADPDLRGLCPDCGQDPANGESAPSGGTAVQERTRVRRKVRKPAAPGHRKRSRHGRRRARALMVFVAIWMSLVALLVIKMKGKDASPPTPAPGYVEKDLQPKKEDLQLINLKLQGCAQHLQEFVAAPDAASRAIHVIHPDKAVSRMVRYYAANPAIPYTGKLRNRFQHVIHTPAGPAIETGWILDDELQVEAVFSEDGSEWKLDWDAYVRFNTESWALFLSAQGPTEGVFRVLARERIGAGGRNDEYIGLVLGVPRFGHPEEVISPSPEIRVKRASEMGRRIEEAFRARETGRGAFESIAVQNDPGEMIRLRVRLVREDGEERTYKIAELLGTHWMEIEEPVVKAE